MRRIVITGATGLVGSRAVLLLRAHREVHAIVRQLPTEPLAGVHYHVHNLGTSWTTDGLPSTVDAVFHLAQSQHFREFPACALETYRVNTSATVTLLDYAARARARRFVLASTGGLYGSCAQVITEETPLNPPVGPLTHYFNTKLSAEILSSAYQSIFGVTVLRPFFIYGAGQSADKLVRRLLESVTNQLPITLTGENGTEMNPVHVDDVARLLLATLDLTGSQTLNVAGPQVVNVRQMAESIGALVSMKPNLVVTAGRSERMVSDIANIQGMLARPLTTFEEGIRSMFARSHCRK